MPIPSPRWLELVIWPDAARPAQRMGRRRVPSSSPLLPPGLGIVMMILCVTLNPCLDKTLTVPPWKPGDSVRGGAVSEIVGGKGNNVARALVRLGRPARPATFFGGPIGTHCEELLRLEGFDPLVTPTRAPTRVILTVRTEETSEQSAFFDPDPEIEPAEAEDFLRKVEAALSRGEVEALTLSGSSPSKAADGLFLDLVSLARMRKIPVFLDTYGPPLESIWGFWPDVIQLNRREAALHLRRPSVDDGAVLEMLGTWARHGVRLALVTDGSRPVLAQFEGTFYRVHPPEIEVVNPIGSGDSLLAGLVNAYLAGQDAESILRAGVASGVSNAMIWEAGRIELETVAAVQDKVVVERLETKPAHETGAEKAAGSSPFLRVGVYGRPTSRYGKR